VDTKIKNKEGCANQPLCRNGDPLAGPVRNFSLLLLSRAGKNETLPSRDYVVKREGFLMEKGNSMKKTINARTILLIIMCVVLGVLFVRNGLETKNAEKKTVTQTTAKPSVSITIDNGKQTEMLTASVSASTPYEALTVAAEQGKRTLTTKQYDFGIFVTGVGDVVGASDYGWIYYVNSVSGTVAADKYELKTGDQVQWKFEKSIF